MTRLLFLLKRRDEMAGCIVESVNRNDWADLLDVAQHHLAIDGGKGVPGKPVTWYPSLL